MPTVAVTRPLTPETGVTSTPFLGHCGRSSAEPSASIACARSAVRRSARLLSACGPGPWGLGCEIRPVLELNQRTAAILVAWHYFDPDAARRLVSAGRDRSHRLRAAQQAACAAARQQLVGTSRPHRGASGGCRTHSACPRGLRTGGALSWTGMSVLSARGAPERARHPPAHTPTRRTGHGGGSCAGFRAARFAGWAARHSAVLLNRRTAALPAARARACLTD